MAFLYCAEFVKNPYVMIMCAVGDLQRKFFEAHLGQISFMFMQFSGIFG